MPVAANPLKRDFYVYQFEVDGYPFYIGIGRSTRADDRLRYVRSLSKAKLAKKCLSVRVMAALDQQKDIKLRKPMQHLTRRQALDQEQRRMARLIKKGFLLTNWHHNPFRHLDVNKAVRAILSKRTRQA